MHIAHDADVAGALFQIQVQGKGIERRVFALENGIGVVFGAVENKVGGGRGSARNIALALGVVAVACVPQFVRQRLPRECKGMIRVVGNLLNFALEVLGVVDGAAVQRDGLDAPCVGDDSDGGGFTALQPHFIIFIVRGGKLFQNSSVSIAAGKGAVRRNNCAVAKALIQSHRNIEVAFWLILSSYITGIPAISSCVKVYCALKGTAIQTVRHIKALSPRPGLQVYIALKGAAVHCNSRIRVILLCIIQHLYILLEGASVDLNGAVFGLTCGQLYTAVKLAAFNDDTALTIFSGFRLQSVARAIKIRGITSIRKLRLAEFHAILDRNKTSFTVNYSGICFVWIGINGECTTFQSQCTISHVDQFGISAS